MLAPSGVVYYFAGVTCYNPRAVVRNPPHSVGSGKRLESLFFCNTIYASKNKGSLAYIMFSP
jgi:hypothetical protein